MAIDVRCGSCGKAYKVPDNIAGRKIRCKACETVIQVSDAAPLDEIDPWDIEEEFGDEPMQAAPRRRRASSDAYYDDRSSGGGLSGTQIVLLCVGAGFLILLLACGGVAYMFVTKAQQFVAEIEEGIAEMEEEARLAREQRATEMAEATLAAFDLSEIGVPVVIDLPEGTTVEKATGFSEEGRKTLAAQLQYGGLIDWYLYEKSDIKTIEDLKNSVKSDYGLSDKDIEVLGDNVLIMKYEGMEVFNGDAIYDFQALIIDGDRRFVIQEQMGESYTREEVEYFARCLQTARPKDGATEAAAIPATTEDAAATTDDEAATGEAAEQ